MTYIGLLTSILGTFWVSVLNLLLRTEKLINIFLLNIFSALKISLNFRN